MNVRYTWVYDDTANSRLPATDDRIRLISRDNVGNNGVITTTAETTEMITTIMMMLMLELHASL